MGMFIKTTARMIIVTFDSTIQLDTQCTKDEQKQEEQQTLQQQSVTFHYRHLVLALTRLAI